jgi:ribonuclease P protein component
LTLDRRMRLTDSSEFERAYRRGTAYRGKLFSVHAFPNTVGNPRLGLSVSRKVGNAVVRNRIRRRIKEIFRGAFGEVTSDVDLVVSARPAAAEAGFEELEGEFYRAVRKLRVANAGRERGGE